MKRKRSKSSGALIIPASKPRNLLVPSALMRKAGAHRKTNKALRAQAKAQLNTGGSSSGKTPGFYPDYEGSILSPPTIQTCVLGYSSVGRASGC